MKVLITGAEGFVGRNLVAGLAALPRLTVLSPSRAELDLRNEGALRRYLEQHELTAIIHAATTLRDGTGYPPDTCESNLRMFFNLQKLKNKKTKLINLGSGSEYSRKHWHGKMKETFFDENIPMDSHSYAKYLISKYIDEGVDKSLVSLRLFGIYGKYEDYRFKFISNAIVKNIMRQAIVINQNVIYDYLCVDDLSRILSHFIENPLLHKSYNVTPTQSIDLVTIAEIINQVSDFRSEIVVLNPGIGVEYSGDNSRLMNELGEFSFMDQKMAIESLWHHYHSIEDSLDVQAVINDEYLNYAKDLRSSYFEQQHDQPSR